MKVDALDSRKIQSTGNGKITKTISIPSQIVKKLDIQPGEEFIVALAKDKIIITRPEDIIK